MRPTLTMSPFMADEILAGSAPQSFETGALDFTGGFDKAAAIMTCHTTTGNLPFKQLCAFVRITTESATKKIVFKTNGT